VGELHYEPVPSARPVVAERLGPVTRITVPMPGRYVPVPKWVFELDLLTLLVAPPWWLAAQLVRLCLRPPKPPRAVFELTDERVKLSLRDPATGEVTAFDWPRAAVVEARANRYEPGLWLHVTGHVKDTYLADLPRDLIDQLDAALADLFPQARSANNPPSTHGSPNLG
jgi:hypothetical protein